MPRFRIYEKQVFIGTYIVEAANEKEARQMYFDNDRLPDLENAEEDEFSFANVVELDEDGKEVG